MTNTLKSKLAVLVSALTLLGQLSPALASNNVGYDKGLYIQTDDEEFKMKLNIQLQPQYQFLAMENQPNTSTFQIRRARFTFSGHAFDKNLTYKFQFEAVSGRDSASIEGANTTGPNLREAYLNYKFNDAIQIRGGQFKPAFNREELTSSTAQQFVGRSINNDVFTHGYDLGAMILGGFFDKKLEYAAYVTNENNNRNTFNLNNDMLFGARLDWNILGQHGFSFADVNDSDEHQLTVGMALSGNKPAASGDDFVHNYTADVSWKYNGFSLFGEGDFSRNHGDKTEILGFVTQAGYFIVPKKFEVAARFAGVMPLDAGVTNGYEADLGVNYYFKGHNLKWQLDYGFLINSPLVLNAANAPANAARTGGLPAFTQDQNDQRIRTQVQLYF